MSPDVSAPTARRVALAAQSFMVDRRAARRRTTVVPASPSPCGSEHPTTEPAGASSRGVRAVVDRLALLQIDSVNVFERSHYLPVFSRLGPYDKAFLDRLSAGRRGRLMEYWAHQAALIPRSAYPLFQWRRDDYLARYAGDPHSWWNANESLRGWLVAELAEKGPLPASAFDHESNRRRGPWWGWSDVKIGLENLFRTGDVVCVERHRFERIYALGARVLDPSVLRTDVPRLDAQRELVRRAALALGIGTAADIADYFRMGVAPTRVALRDLEDSGELLPVTVDGWTTGSRSAAAWMHRDRAPSGASTAVFADALLSPFDPVVWNRSRAHRMFDFHYRIEIYTPPDRRQFGYYSLPILMDGALVGRVDLKSDRARSTLRVRSAWLEASAPPDVAERLLALVRSAAQWQGLADIDVEPRGTLAPALADALHAVRGTL